MCLYFPIGALDEPLLVVCNIFRQTGRRYAFSSRMEPVRALNVKVLVLEDDDFQRCAIASFCEQAGYKVQAVGSGEECVRLIEGAGQDSPWDLVFCDVWLGNEPHGVDILLRLRRKFDTGISIIMVSANEQAHIVEQCILEGADTSCTLLSLIHI